MDTLANDLNCPFVSRLVSSSSVMVESARLMAANSSMSVV